MRADTPYQPQVTAKDLLIKVLDYNRVWSSPDKKNSPPAITRLAQIASLQAAFGLSDPYLPIKSITNASEEETLNQSRINELHLDYLMRGEFIKERKKTV